MFFQAVLFAFSKKYDIMSIYKSNLCGRRIWKSKKNIKEKEKDEMRSFDVDDFFAHALDRSYGKKDD